MDCMKYSSFLKTVEQNEKYYKELFRRIWSLHLLTTSSSQRHLDRFLKGFSVLIRRLHYDVAFL